MWGYHLTCCLGHKELLHRRPVAYYDSLLGKTTNKNTKAPMICDEANPNERVGHVAINSGVADEAAPSGHRVLALTDRHEGDPEDDEVADLPEGLSGPRAIVDADAREVNDADDVTDFVPFTFVRAQRHISKGPRKGQMSWSWQVTCPFHRDPGDNPNTMCRRAVLFHGLSEEGEAIIRLKMWCIAGRRTTSRAIFPHGHKFMNVSNSPLDTNESLINQLKEGLSQRSWIQSDAPEDPADTSSSQESS